MVHNRMRRTTELSCSLMVLGSLLFLPACSIPGNLRQQNDHVFSTVAPHDLDMQTDGQPLPAKASYPAMQHAEGSGVGYPASVSRRQLDRLQRQAHDFSPDDGVVRIAAPYTRTSDQEHARVVEPAVLTADSEFQFASVQPAGFSQDSAACPPQFYPAEPRIDLSQRGCPPNTMETVAFSSLAERYPEEYIFDGGDRDLPVHYNGASRRGLDTEDTIVEYRDQAGDFKVTPSNRVAVYAPRFGSVRAITGLEADVKYDRAAGARDTLLASNLNTGSAAQQNVQGVNPLQLLEQQRLNEYETALPPTQSAATDRPEQTRKVDQGLQGRAVVSANAFERLDTPILAEQLQNAVAWTRDEYPVITASTTSASEIIAKFRLQETVAVEDQRKTDGRIRIVKLADRAIAQSGDVIEFTIHFQNTGDFPVYDVRISDNLTPRLEYVPGSASIDEQHPGEVIAAPNGEGSHVMTFVLDERLEGHSSGTIRFEARVK